MSRSKRMGQAPGGVRTGTLTLLLLVTAIVLSVIAVLALQTARSNEARADAFAYNVEQFYKNDAAGQAMLAELDELLSRGGELDAANVQSAIPAGFTVSGDMIRGAFLDGQPRAYDSIDTESKTYNDGIATDGRSQVDATSKPALLVEVQVADGEYQVRTWTHVRAYDEADAESESSLFTGTLGDDQEDAVDMANTGQKQDSDQTDQGEDQGE